MLLPSCNDCKKPLQDANAMIAIPEMVFFTKSEEPRAARNLHFCDEKCCHSFVVKTINRPNLITPHA